jgi:hypothetical protein
MDIPPALLDQVPEAARNKACVCRACVVKYHRSVAASSVSVDSPNHDFYLEDGFVVFTEAYLRRRGYCCGSGCRHCPYPKSSGSPAKKAG